MPDTLYDFLLARIAEDEAKVEAAIAADLDRLHHDGVPGLTREDLLTTKPGYDASWLTRPLAECEAKRRIINHEAAWTDHGHEVLQLLALPYADHPDYRPEWRPLGA